MGYLEAKRLFETTGRLTVDVVKAGPVHVEKSTPVGGSRTLETMAEREDKLINAMISALSALSEEDGRRVLQRIEDGLRRPEGSGKQVGVTKAAYPTGSKTYMGLNDGFGRALQSALHDPTPANVVKAGTGFPAVDAAFDALMAKHDVSVSKAEGPTPYLDRMRWQ